MRISVVDTIEDHNISLAGNFIIGDTYALKPVIRTFAIQREYPQFLGNEGDFNDFPIFSVSLLKANIYEKVNTTFINDHPIIKVDHVKINSIAGASIVQVGSTQDTYTQSRILNIRHYFHPPAD
ncbi:spore germination protein GerPE [Camelliibacillus cellulosilyticus]|uniref:Spore germination protein GerPE n=1 Tax=Camelliibacillus cellulosilyticus TaxID=2174486 RepID=A0ABV9GM66_9BACL